MKEVEGKNGGKLLAMQPGDKPPANAGRPKNPFKQYIRDFAETQEIEMVLSGIVLDDDDQPTGEKVRVLVSLPGAMSVVIRMYKQAARKGDVAAAKWLSETGFGKTLNLGQDEENPIGGGFAIVLPSNGR